MLNIHPRSALWRAVARVITRLQHAPQRDDVPASLRVTLSPEARPAVPAAYLPLYTYLDRRYAATVVLTFEEIEALLGFPPPSEAFADAAWWTGARGASDRHTAAWTAARRSAVPRLAARTVEFERLS